MAADHRCSARTALPQSYACESEGGVPQDSVVRLSKVTNLQWIATEHVGQVAGPSLSLFSPSNACPKGKRDANRTKNRTGEFDASSRCPKVLKIFGEARLRQRLSAILLE